MEEVGRTYLRTVSAEAEVVVGNSWQRSEKNGNSYQRKYLKEIHHDHQFRPI